MAVKTTNLHVSDWMDLWVRDLPSSMITESLSERQTEQNNFTDVGVPQMQVWFPAPGKSTGAAALIFSGGSYAELASGKEASDCASWLAERGILAVIVKHRVAHDLHGFPLHPFPLLDARRAIRVIRSVAQDWGVSKEKIGVVGFASGGHLASNCATLWDHAFDLEVGDRIDDESCRPDFAAMVYPVITMLEDWAADYPRSKLLGKRWTLADGKLLSSELHVNSETPPCFIVHSGNDDVVSARNSLLFASKCYAAGVKASCYLFEDGGHGYGLQGEGESAALPALFESWLIARGLMG